MPEPTLTTNEIIYRRHPLNLLRPIAVTILLVILLMFFVIAFVLFDVFPFEEYLPHMALFTGLLLSMIASYFMMQWVFWYFDFWVLTSDKLIDSQLITFFLRSRSEIALRQVQDIRHNVSGTLATLFQFGDVTVQSAAKDGHFTIMSVSQPKDVVREIALRCETAAQPTVTIADSAGPVQQLGETLVKRKMLSKQDLATALSEQIGSGKRLSTILLDKGLVTRSQLTAARSSQYRIPEVSLGNYDISDTVIQHISSEIAQRYHVIPVSADDDSVLVAMGAPSRDRMDAVQGLCSKSVDFVVANEEDIKQAIARYYGAAPTSKPEGGGPQQDTSA